MDLVLGTLDEEKVATLVEVGPGMGAASWRLAQGRTYEGYEPDLRSFQEASRRLRGLANVKVVNAALPSDADSEFDALVAMEVLEHLEDDKAAFDTWTGWVRPGGPVLLSVPAHQSRYGPMDVAVGHYRRYGRDQPRSVMETAGLTDITIRAYGMPAGYLLEWVRNRFLASRVDNAEDRSEGTAASGRSFQPKAGSWIIRLVMTPLRWMQKPFQKTDLGIGWVAWGRRPL